MTKSIQQMYDAITKGDVTVEEFDKWVKEREDEGYRMGREAGLLGHYIPG